jgi:flagellar FliJ protein
MKKFRFPLRPVAILRAHRHMRASEAFAVAVHAYVRAEEHLATLQLRRQELETDMHDGRREIFQAVVEISCWGAYRRVCAVEIMAERGVSEARAALDERRRQYLEAHRAVKVVEKLEEKARADYRLQGAREAQLELDELAGQRGGRRVANTGLFS